MKSVFQLTVSVFVFLLLLASCQKSGTGPEGAKGDPGPAGPTGPTGAANVIYSAWFTAAPWIKDTVFYIYGFSYSKAVPEITQNIIDSGTVITYAKLNGYNTLIWPAGQIAQMPIILDYKFSSAGVTYTDTWSALVTPGKLKIRFVNDLNYYGSIDATHTFRYIIIPGGKKGSNRLAALSYHDICAMYNIPE